MAHLRCVFDLDAPMDQTDAHLALDPRMTARVQARPGLRVPGAGDLFELMVRALLGQQISVAAATTLSGSLAMTGEPPTGTIAQLAQDKNIFRIIPPHPLL